jgi:hypothetical protein
MKYLEYSTLISLSFNTFLQAVQTTITSKGPVYQFTKFTISSDPGRRPTASIRLRKCEFAVKSIYIVSLVVQLKCGQFNKIINIKIKCLNGLVLTVCRDCTQQYVYRDFFFVGKI